MALIYLISFGSFVFIFFLLGTGLSFKLLAACLLLDGYIECTADKGWFISEINLYITGISQSTSK